MDSDPDSSSRTACVWWRNPQPSVDSKQGESTRGRRKEGEGEIRETCLKSICMKKKRHPTPPYIGQGGVPPPSTSGVGLIPKEGGLGAALGGWAPLMVPWPMGEDSLSPNGPYEAHMPFLPFLIIFKYISIFNSDN